MSVREERLTDSFFKKLVAAIPQHKFEKIKNIGSGTRGIAYDIGNNTVMKITDDFSEANTSNFIKDKKLKYVNEIFDVLHLEVGPYKDDYYLIFQKKLKPLSEEEFKFIRKFIEPMDDPDIGFDEFKKFSEVPEKYIQDYYRKVDRTGKDAEGDSLGQLLKLVNFFISFRNELKKNKIHFSDWHPGNIMKDGDNYKLIDIGYSNAPETKINKKMIESHLIKKFGL